MANALAVPLRTPREPVVCPRAQHLVHEPADGKAPIRGSRANRLEKPTRYLDRSGLAPPANDTLDPRTDVARSPATRTLNRSPRVRDMSRTQREHHPIPYRTRADPLLIPPRYSPLQICNFPHHIHYFKLKSRVNEESSGIEVRLPYHNGLLGAHMHDPSATRPGEVDTMTGKWLGAPLGTPSHQVRLSRGTGTEVDLVPSGKPTADVTVVRTDPDPEQLKQSPGT